MADAKAKDVVAGTILVADGGFTCIKQGTRLTVQADETGELYVPCRSGRHYLDGQYERGRYIGLSHPAFELGRSQ